MSFTKQFANTIQYLCLPQDSWFPDELFFRGNGKTLYSENDPAAKRALLVPENETVSLDTYFNMFPVFKWLRYTNIADLSVDVVLKGYAKVSLAGLNRKDPDKEITLKETEFHAAEEASFRILECADLAGESALPDFLFLKISSLGTEVVLYDVLFSTGTQRDPDLNIACCFCTFKREADIKRNVENLLTGIVHNEASSIHDRLHIYVSDNGQTLPLDLYENEPAVHLFYNKNYGGSAGFTRCMIESCFRNEGRPFSHIILMDDDALILPEVVERTAALIGIIKDEYRDYMIGGGLLSKERPQIQSENGVLLDLNSMEGALSGANADLTFSENLISNEMSSEDEVNYNGWWFTCIPASVITEDNLPLPLFIHYDDQEYGVRNGGRFIRLNGICAWHPSVKGSSRKRAHMTYYQCRNTMIVRSLYCADLTAGAVLKYLLKVGISNILNYMYQDCFYAGMGTRDFYKGIDNLKGIDADQLNQSIMKAMPFEACILSDKELNDLDLSGSGVPLPKRNLKRILNWFVPSRKEKKIFDQETNEKTIDIFRVKEYCLVNAKTGKGNRFKKSYRQAFKALLDLIKASFIVIRRHKKVCREWQSRIPELETLEFWERYLEI